MLDKAWSYGSLDCRMKFLKYVIENCGSVGAYLKNDATYPVSYANLGYLHITKTQMKRITAVLSIMKEMLEIGVTPID